MQYNYNNNSILDNYNFNNNNNYNNNSNYNSNVIFYPSLQQSQLPQQHQQEQQNETTNNLHYEGWLQKKGERGVVLTWKKRYFIADMESIKYFTEVNCTNLKGIILWEHIVNIKASAFAVWNDNRYFEIHTNRGRTYYLFSDDKGKTSQWIAALTRIQTAYIGHLKALEHQEQLLKKQQQEQQEQQQRYQEQQEQFEQFSQKTFSSPYKDYLNFVQRQGYAHFGAIEDDSLHHHSASLQSDSVLNVPPRPPEPLRVLTHERVKAIMPSEGKDLEIYYQSTTHFASVLMHKTQDFCLLAAYLVISTLDWDNKKTLTLPGVTPYESDIEYPYFAYSIQLIRTEILNRWKHSGPTYITQIDTFVKKKRQNFLVILENEDMETFVNRNLLLLNYILQYTVIGHKLALIEDSLLVLIDRFLERFESLPSIVHSAFLLDEMSKCEPLANMTPSDIELLKSFTQSYLLYQKLHGENKHNSRFRMDPTIKQKYEGVSHQFSLVLNNHPVLSPFAGQIQRTVVKIFIIWSKNLPLCETTSTLDVSIYRNYKVFIRILSKLDPTVFQQLYSTVNAAKDTLYSHIERHFGEANNVDVSSLEAIQPTAMTALTK